MILAGVTLAALAALLNLLPSLQEVRASHPPSHVEALDGQGHVLERLRIDFSREQAPWIVAEDLPRSVREAIVRQEDRRFASHPGIDVLAIAGTLRDAVFVAKRRGASTLAMQDARLVFPSLRALPPAARKLSECILALGLTARWGREGILEVWSNLVPMPGGRRGLPTAARTWIGAGLPSLTREETTRLVAAARGPGRLRDPIRKPSLNTMASSDARTPLLLQSLLTQKENHFPEGAKEAALRSGFVRTTLDGDLQARIELLAREERARLAKRNVGDLAVIVVDNATGRILASVGNAARTGEPQHWVDNAHARRQAGSTLKPFLYALAIEKNRLSAHTLLSDAPYERMKPSGSYRPRNYDGLSHGAVPASVALASSLNLPALRVLDLVGQESFAARLEALGFSVDDAPGVLGESVALGTLDVTLEQLAAAYTALARGGVRVPLSILQPGRAEPRTPLRKETRVMSEAAAREIARILASDADRSLSFGANSPLSTSVAASVKTGTSVDMRDNWCVGFTDLHTVAVWAGNPDGSPMWDVSGVEGAAPLWHDVIELLARPSHRSNARAAPLPSAKRVPVSMNAVADTPTRSRIVSPLRGSVYARDPGLPPSAQRLVIEAAGELDGLTWHLDGKEIAPAASAIAWDPVRGTHTLALVDPARGATLDTATFVVK